MESAHLARKTIVIPEYVWEQVEKWKDEHNKTCSIPEKQPHQFTNTSKFVWQIREMGMGDGITVICDCGQKFEPEIDY